MNKNTFSVININVFKYVFICCISLTGSFRTEIINKTSEKHRQFKSNTLLI